MFSLDKSKKNSIEVVIVENRRNIKHLQKARITLTTREIILFDLDALGYSVLFLRDITGVIACNLVTVFKKHI
eukprot:snap_masked-scaffold_18-processed-gene-6.34-mRNA-1 protein AED:1.00 eAED:1.00 QI:0/-1/0/0/-1/1/1/0/72